MDPWHSISPSTWTHRRMKLSRMPEPPSIHRNSSRICNLTKANYLFLRFFSLYDEIPKMPHTVTVEAAFQFWRVVSVDSQHQHEQRSHPQNYGQGKLLVRFRGKYFLLLRRTLVSRRARWPTSLPLQYGFLRCPKSLSLSLYLHNDNICQEYQISHEILCHWTFLLGHRSYIQCHSSPEKEMIPPFLHLQSPLGYIVGMTLLRTGTYWLQPWKDATTSLLRIVFLGHIWTHWERLDNTKEHEGTKYHGQWR